MRLIDKDALKERCITYINGDRYVAEWRIEDEPEIEAEPVKHGRWENGNPICPVCGKDKFKDLDADIWCDWQPAFCPNCGAKMDLEG